MIQCKSINNSDFSLEEREKRFAEIRPDTDKPHVLLQTCNRTELYWGAGDVPDGIVRHLYRVTSGLESSLTGERAIQGQVKTAYCAACERYHLSPQLHKLFQTAMHVGKRVRNETGISEGAVSHSQATAEILKRETAGLKDKVVGIVGVNKLTEDILKFLTAKQALQVFLSNRNIAKAEALARQYGGTAVRLDEKKRLLDCADILICATSAPHVVVRREDIPEGRNMLIFDLAFPRDVESSVADMKGIRLYNLEDIEHFAQQNLSLRNEEAEKAERIIEEEIGLFYGWYRNSVTCSDNTEAKNRGDCFCAARRGVTSNV
ncbi:MAG: glutamyl-tRNA reductase [Bacteroidales bacterium]|jgi:glutamyl-tRNA reductase|nr:glutamyl-tRNA reductase [Bacteroidales bacterium]